VRKVIIAGNWKMFKTQAESAEFMQAFLPLTESTPEERAVVLCVPFTDLVTVSKFLHGSLVRLGAQNVHWEVDGAYTGEISAGMLVELGVRYVIIGHSERRQYFGEVDRTVNLRIKAAQQQGLLPILCVGETKEQHDAGQTKQVIAEQLRWGLVDVDLQKLVIAYEPIWAIGTGDTCAADEANRTIGEIRAQVGNPNVTIQYGGSVKPDNIDEIMAQPEIDGVLVGGASLDAKSFARIANYVG
jgi:triosephosphate isomerase (TIM)